jgi:hypothetical protein
MSDKRPLNFAQRVGRQRPPDAEPASPPSTTPDSQLSTAADSSLSTTLASQFPPPSQQSTTLPEPASRIAKPRKVESHRRGRVDNRKGDRHRNDKVPYNNRIGPDTFKRIKHFIADHDLEQQEFAELSAIHFIDAVESQKAEAVDSKIALDDRELMILFKTDPRIINLYLHYNPENRWKPADDVEGQRYAGKDIRLVEVGIIQTQFNARFKKINSFRYYTTEIDIALETTPPGSDYIAIMLTQARRRWASATGREALT